MLIIITGIMIFSTTRYYQVLPGNFVFYTTQKLFTVSI